MPDSNPPSSQEKTLTDEGEQIVIRANYELFVLVLTLLQVVNWLLILIVRDEQAERVPMLINWGLVLFFLGDASYRLWRTPDRRRFLLQFHGYLILLGSLPFPFSGLLRLFWYRVVFVRVRRSDFIKMERVVVRKRAQSAMLAVLLAAIIVFEVSSIAIIQVERRSPNANILEANEAMWWSIVTMATVGYGDFFPVTNSGRLVAVFVMVVGVGIFTVLTSFFAQSFLRPRWEKDEFEHVGADSESHDAWSSIEAIKQLLDEQELAHSASIAELREKLNSLEDQLPSARDDV